MLAALLLSLVHQDRVDVRLPAAIGEVMAPRLSALFGVTIKTDPSLAEVPLIFNVKNVTFEEFRPIAAKGLDATWKEERGTWVLYRTPEQVKNEESEFLARRTATLKKVLTEREPTPMTKQDDIDQFANDIRFLADDDLMDRLYEENGLPDELIGDIVFKALGTDYLASLPVDRRIIYTSDGRKGTKKLDALAQVIDLVQKETDRFEAALKKSGAWNRLENSASINAEYLYWWLDYGTVAYFVLELVSTQSSVAFHLTGFNSNDETCVQYYDAIYGEETLTSTVPQEIGSQSAELSQASIDYRKAYLRLFEDEEADYYQFFVDVYSKLPDQDPLGFEVSDVLFAVADKAQKPLAGRLSDDFMEYGDFELFYNDEEAEDFMEIKSIPIKAGVAWIDGFVQVSVEDDAVRVTPELPTKFQPVFPRRAMGEYVRANVGSMTLDLNRLPRLARAPFSSEATNLGSSALMVHNTSMSEETNFDLVTTWAKLTAPQRQQAQSARGITLPLSNCSDLLRFSINSSAVNYGQWSIIYGDLEGSEENYEESYDEMDIDRDSINDWILEDLDMSSLDRLQVNIRGRNVMRVRVMTEADGAWAMTAEELASWFYMAEQEEDKSFMEEFTKNTYALDEAVEVQIRYDTPIGVMSASTTVTSRANVVKDRPFQQLPAAFMQEFNAALTKLRNGGLKRAG